MIDRSDLHCWMLSEKKTPIWEEMGVSFIGFLSVVGQVKALTNRLLPQGEKFEPQDEAMALVSSEHSFLCRYACAGTRHRLC